MIQHMIAIENEISDFLQHQITSIENTKSDLDVLSKITDTLIQARDNGSTVFTMGNGGSGSTASHFVSDLLKTTITQESKRFSAISLVDNIPVLLAWSNDVSYDDIFIEQLKNHLKPNDVVIGFSGSGKSKNVLKAFEYAKSENAKCIGFTGMSGGLFPSLCDLYHIVPSDDMLLIESTHVFLFHAIISAIRNMGTPLFTYE